MDSPSANKSIPFLLALAAILAIVLIATVGSWAASTQAPGGGPHLPIPPLSSPPATTQITEEEAHSLVWVLPEVQAEAEQLGERGSRPLTLTISTPEPLATPGTEEAAFYIRLSEDRGDHIAGVETFVVDAYSRQVSIYDMVQGRRVSLEEWRGRRK